jgi:hypothetical protein
MKSCDRIPFIGMLINDRSIEQLLLPGRGLPSCDVAMLLLTLHNTSERPVLQNRPKETPKSGRFKPSYHCGVDTSSPCGPNMRRTRSASNRDGSVMRTHDSEEVADLFFGADMPCKAARASSRTTMRFLSFCRRLRPATCGSLCAGASMKRWRL